MNLSHLNAFIENSNNRRNKIRKTTWSNECNSSRDGVLLDHPVKVPLLLLVGEDEGVVGVVVLQLGQVAIAHLEGKIGGLKVKLGHQQ